VQGSCEHGNEPSGYIKCWEIFELLSNCWLLQNVSALWSYSVMYGIQGNEYAHTFAIKAPTVNSLCQKKQFQFRHILDRLFLRSS
jgi:hypothetical protein